MKLVLGLMAVALMCASCASFDNAHSPEKIDPAAVGLDAGVVVLSTGAASRCVAAVTQLNLAPAGLPYAKGGLLGINVDNYAVKSDFSTHQGNLSVFVLKAGDYQLYPSVLNPYSRPTVVPKAEFSVRAGEVLYIGEYFLTEACSFKQTTSVFRDQEARDFALLRQRNPRLRDRQITKRLATFRGNILDEGKN